MQKHHKSTECSQKPNIPTIHKKYIRNDDSDIATLKPRSSTRIYINPGWVTKTV